MHVACLWMCVFSLPLLFVYRRMRMSSNPRSIVGVPFDSGRILRTILYYCAPHDSSSTKFHTGKAKNKKKNRLRVPAQFRINRFIFEKFPQPPPMLQPNKYTASTHPPHFFSGKPVHHTQKTSEVLWDARVLCRWEDGCDVLFEYGAGSCHHDVAATTRTSRATVAARKS